MKRPPGLENQAEALLGQAADEFLEQVRRGEAPVIEDYAERYPEIAAIISEVFPALCAMSVLSGTDGAPKDSDAGLFAPDHELGDFRIVCLLGRGGMGVVYEAVQRSLGRRVALKVLPFAAVLDNKQLQRFRTEAQAAAQLHHSSIVPVYSVGCERGVHFYAMQYIEGRSLSAVIEELKALRALPDRDAAESSRSHACLAPLLQAESVTDGEASDKDGTHSTAPSTSDEGTTAADTACTGLTVSRSYYRAVARIGIEAAHALQHAHDHGVIHRDIKPANLLLDTAGQLWITDFGLAAVQGAASLTLSGDLLGTMRYMSPEQARANRVPVDHRTDIYSLGATLYELLTLQPVLRGEDRNDLLAEIAHRDPRPIRQIAPTVPRELATIVHKSLGKLPEERYTTSSDLAADLQRFLDNRPILARPPNTLDRAGKWARRHRSLVALATVSLVVISIGCAVGAVLVARERNEALRQRDLAADRAEWAESSLQLAQQTFDRMLMSLAGQNMDGGPQGGDLREVLLQDALAFQNHFLNEKEDESAVRGDAARAYQRVGHINALLGRVDQAVAAYREAITILTALADSQPNLPDHRRDLADTRIALVRTLCDHDRADEAMVPAELAVADCRSLIDALPDEVWPAESLVDALNVRGAVYRDLGDIGSAASSFDEAAGVATQLAAAHPDDPDHQRRQARTLRNLADVAVRRKDWKDATTTVDQALEIQKQLVANHPDVTAYSADLAQTERWWDAVQRSGGVPADNVLSPADSTVRRQLTDSLPRIPWYREKLARAYGELGSALQRLDEGPDNKVDDAGQTAIALQEQLAAEFPTVPKYREELANLYFRQGMAAKVAWRMAEAEQLFSQAQAVMEKLVTEFKTEARYQQTLRQIDANLADARRKRAFDSIVQLGKESPQGVADAVHLAESTGVDDIVQDHYVLLVYGEYLALGGDYERALQFIQRSMETGPPGPAHYKSLAWVLLGCHREKEARAAFEQALGSRSTRDIRILLRQCPDPTTASYFLDLITEQQYTDAWRDKVLFGQRYAPFPWFYVGLRRELAGDTAGAIAAYRKAASFTELSHAHHTANWAAYRLSVLTGAK